MFYPRQTHLFFVRVKNTEADFMVVALHRRCNSNELVKSRTHSWNTRTGTRWAGAQNSRDDGLRDDDGLRGEGEADRVGMLVRPQGKGLGERCLTGAGGLADARLRGGDSSCGDAEGACGSEGLGVTE